MQEITADCYWAPRSSASFFLIMLLPFFFDKFFIKSLTTYTLTPKRSATSFCVKVRFEATVMILKRVVALS